MGLEIQLCGKMLAWHMQGSNFNTTKSLGMYIVYVCRLNTKNYLSTRMHAYIHTKFTKIQPKLIKIKIE